MFTTLVLAIHILVCIALIMIILLQSGKGADIGAVFGGGSSNTLFGSTGATPFLSKLTIAAAVIFMVTSIILTYFSGKGVPREGSVVGDYPAPVSAPMSMPGTETDEETPSKGEATPAEKGTSQTGTVPSAPAAKPEPAPVGGSSGALPSSGGATDK